MHKEKKRKEKEKKRKEKENKYFYSLFRQKSEKKR